MQTKLTLRLDDELIRRAKAWARARGLSLSEAVGAVFAQLPEDTGEAPLRVGPWMRQLIGAAGPAAGAGSDEEIRREHRAHLERKYA